MLQNRTDSFGCWLRRAVHHAVSLNNLPSRSRYQRTNGALSWTQRVQCNRLYGHWPISAYLRLRSHRIRPAGLGRVSIRARPRQSGRADAYLQ